jgi:hypothetical protein
MIGWGTVWEYPDNVYVELEEAAPAADWGAGDDAWNRPPPGWQPPEQAGQEP